MNSVDSPWRLARDSGDVEIAGLVGKFRGGAVDITNLQQSTEPGWEKSLKLLEGKESDAQGKGRRGEEKEREAWNQ